MTVETSTLKKLRALAHRHGTPNDSGLTEAALAKAITSLTAAQLREIAKHHNLPRYSTLTKTDLILDLTDRGIALERLPPKAAEDRTRFIRDSLNSAEKRR